MLDNSSSPSTFYVPIAPRISSILCPSVSNIEGKLVQDYVHISSLQCYSVLSDIFVKNELCIPLERGLNALSTGEGFICLSPPSKLKIAVLFCSIYKKTTSFSAIVF